MLVDTREITRALEKIAEVELERENEEEVWKTTLKETIFLNLRRSNDCEVYISWRTGTDDQLMDLQGYKTRSAEEAIERFRLYHSFAQTEIDPNYLPEYDEWQKEKYGIPQNPDLVAMTTIKFELRMPCHRILKADRFFSRPSRTGVLRVSYDGPHISEVVSADQGRVLNVSTRMHHDWGSIPDEGVWEWFKEQMEKTRPEQMTFHNIKKYEQKLKELPWQKDFEAIYSHSGILE